MNGVKDASIEAEDVRRWWDMWPLAGIGLATGPRSGVMALDIDQGSGGFESLEHLQLEHGRLPDTVMSLTGGGGRHYLFRDFPGARNRAKVVAGVDVRGDGGYIVLPPSKHVMGAYEWAVDQEPWAEQIADAPEWLVDRIRTKVPASGPGERRDALDIVKILQDGIDEGERDNTLFRLAAKLRGDNVSTEVAKRILLDAAAKCNPPFDPKLAVAKVDWAFERYEAGRLQQQAGPMPDPPKAAVVAESPLTGEATFRTDLGNAIRLVRDHGHDLRYCSLWGKWLVWDGLRWRPDSKGGASVFSRAVDVVKALRREAAEMDDPDERKKAWKWALDSESKGKLDAMISLAAKMPAVAIEPEDLDQHHLLLNCKSGTVDLATGMVFPHNRAHLITKLVPIAYNPDADLTSWARFLDDIIPDVDVQRFLAKAAGYSLTGDTSEQCMFFLHGSGANGKTTLVETIRLVLGDYAISTPAETFTAKVGDQGANPEIARLKGARMVCSDETEEGKRLSESLIKWITGGNTITARHLYNESFDFRPTFKIWLAGNHKPDIRGADDGIWRRLRLLPFTVSIPEDKRDRGLADKLRMELPGILAWMVAGCKLWFNEGLGTAGALDDALAEYRSEQDVLGRFIEDCADVAEGKFCPVGVLYKAYVAWSEANKEYVRSRKRFSQDLSRRGFQRDQVGAGRDRGFWGLTLKEDQAQEHWWNR